MKSVEEFVQEFDAQPVVKRFNQSLQTWVHIVQDN